MKEDSQTSKKLKTTTDIAFQLCPKCGRKIGVIAGSKDAICLNCGFKDACCE